MSTPNEIDELLDRGPNWFPAPVALIELLVDDPMLLQVWVLVMSRVRRSSSETLSKRGQAVGYGQALTGEREIATRFGVSRKRVRTALLRLEKLGFWHLDGDHRGTVLTVHRYSDYLALAQDEGTGDGTTGGPPEDHRGTTEGPKQDVRGKKGKKKTNGLAGFSSDVIAAATSVLSKLNERLELLGDARSYPVSKTYVQPIARLLADGHSEHDLRTVIWDKANNWGDDEKMQQYIRPETLFAVTKFPGYLVAARAAEKQGLAPSGTPRPVGDRFGGVE